MGKVHRACLGLAAAAALAFSISACSAPAAAPAPTAAPAKAAEPAAAPKAAAPTQAPAAPTAAPAAKTDFPTAGKPITIIVGAAAGGPNDVSARLIAPLMEKDLGTPVQVVNKPGAGWQVGLTEMAKSKPDGYTIGYAPLPQTILVYLDPERKTAFGRKDVQPLAMHVVDPGVMAVKKDSPIKTLKDLVDAGKAKPGTIKEGDTGILGDDHVAAMMLEQQTGFQFAQVHFEGAALVMTALLGGHIDVYVGNVGDVITQARAGEVRVLGVMDKERSKYLPDVPTFEEQGFKLTSSSSRAIAMPAGAPKDVLDRLNGALKKAITDPEHMKKMDEGATPVKYMDMAQVTTYWDDMEKAVAPMVDLAKRK